MEVLKCVAIGWAALLILLAIAMIIIKIEEKIGQDTIMIILGVNLIAFLMGRLILDVM